MEEKEQEVWKDIPDFIGKYQISNLGRVRCITKNIGNIRIPSLSSSGYYHINLCGKTIPVHKLMKKTFMNYTGNENLVINHIDYNKLNNRLDNLELVTNRYNVSISKLQKFKTSKYTGVYFLKNKNLWYSAITINKKIVFLGSYKDEYTAHIIYELALKNISLYNGEHIIFKKYIQSLINHKPYVNYRYA